MSCGISFSWGVPGLTNTVIFLGGRLFGVFIPRTWALVMIRLLSNPNHPLPSPPPPFLLSTRKKTAASLHRFRVVLSGSVLVGGGGLPAAAVPPAFGNWPSPAGIACFRSGWGAAFGPGFVAGLVAGAGVSGSSVGSSRGSSVAARCRGPADDGPPAPGVPVLWATVVSLPPNSPAK